MKQLSEMTEPELRDLFNSVATEIQHRLPERTLFVLLAFDDPGLSQYVSNARREDVIKALYEGASRLENEEDVKR